MTITWNCLPSSDFSSPTKWRLGTQARELGKWVTFASELVDELGFPEEHDVLLMSDCFFLYDS